MRTNTTKPIVNTTTSAADKQGIAERLEELTGVPAEVLVAASELSKEDQEKLKVTLVAQTKIVERKENKSELIRRCFFDEGMSIATIAKESGIRYQQVRNVVVNEKAKREAAATEAK